LEPALGWIERYPITCALLLPLMPPPVPLTPLVLISGATGVPRRRFFPAFTLAMSLRYLLVAWLGEIYGRRIIRLWAWLLRNWSGPLVWIVVILLLGAAVFGFWHAYIRNRRTRSKAEAVEVTASARD
jgi:uncharacterized membrane protein YdjX (TVP38/TMEM64 family)